MRIDEELMEIWPNEVCDTISSKKNSLDIWINEGLRKGYICPSISPIAVPFFFVKKHNRSL